MYPRCLACDETSVTVAAAILTAAVSQLDGVGSALRLEDVTVLEYRESGAHDFAITVNDDSTRTVEGSMSFGIPIFTVASGHTCTSYEAGDDYEIARGRQCITYDNSPPCEVSQGGRCVGRPQGYGPNEECTITVSGGGGLLEDRCSIFDTESGYDVIALPGGETHSGSDCPLGAPLVFGDELVWYSNTDAGNGGHGLSGRKTEALVVAGRSVSCLRFPAAQTQPPPTMTLQRL